MERILVAVDDDEQAQSVVALAGEIATSCDATLTICHVMPEEQYRRIEARQLREQVEVPFSLSDAELQAREMAAEVARPLSVLNVSFHPEGRVGEPADAIVGLAREIDADLIVVGFEGLRGLQRIRALGSVSRAVMEKTNRPVLVVPAVREA